MTAPMFTEGMATLPTDEELLILHRYTSGAMSEIESDEFEERLAQDPAFYYAVAPMLKLWHTEPTALEKSIARAAVQRVRRARETRRNLTVGGMLAAAAIVFAIVRTEIGSKPSNDTGPKPRATIAATEAPKTASPSRPRRTAIPRATVAQAPIVVESDFERELVRRAESPLPGFSFVPVQPDVALAPAPASAPLAQLAWGAPDTLGMGRDRGGLPSGKAAVNNNRPRWWPPFIPFPFRRKP